MITIVNNCLAMIDIGEQLQKQYWQNEPTEEMNDVLRRLKDIYIVSKKQSVNICLSVIKTFSL